MIRDVIGKRKHVVGLTVRHVGALVATLTAIRPRQLQATKPVAATQDGNTIGSAFAAIVRAEPRLTTELGEARWSLTFTGRDGQPVLVVTTSLLHKTS
jgi:hypothetical protein